MAERKINGRTFKVEPMLAMNALILQARLMKVIGGGIDRLPDIIGGAGDKATPEAKAKAQAAAVAAFSDIFTTAEPVAMANLVKDIVETAKMQRPSGTYENVDLDGDFSGNLGDVIPVVIFVLKEQFGSFFSGALANGGLGLKPKG